MTYSVSTRTHHHTISLCAFQQEATENMDPQHENAAINISVEDIPHPTYGLVIKEVDGERLEELRISWIQKIATHTLSAGEALIEAVEDRDPGRVNQLLENSKHHNDPDRSPPIPISSEDRSIALKLAVKDNQSGIVFSLLRQGSIRPSDRAQAVIEAYRQGMPQMAEVLFNGRNDDPLLVREWIVSLSATYGYLNIIQTILQNGPITHFCRGGAILVASTKGHTGIVQTLLQNGPISDDDRVQAFLIALQNHHVEIALLLRDQH